MEIQPEHLIAEMRHDVEVEDVIKARLVLSHLRQIDPASQASVLEVLASGAARFSLPLLAELLAREPWIELSHPLLLERVAALAATDPEFFLQQLSAARGRQLAILAGAASQLEMPGAQGALLAALREETASTVLEAVIEALGRVGGENATNPISEYLYANEPALIAAAARALAHIGSPTAVERLSQRIGVDPELDEIFIGILWEVQTDEALKALVVTLSSPHAHVRAAGRQALYMSGPHAVPVLLDALRSPDDDRVIHCLDILGDIGDASAYAGIRQLLHRHSQNPNIRFSAYEALGKLPMQGRGFALAEGLEDPVDNVRVAAASAIERNLDPALASGVRNLLTTGGEQDRRILRALVTARSAETLLALAADSRLRALLVNDFMERSHAETTLWFAERFRARGADGLAAEISARKAAAAERARVFAVDDSLLILSIYRSALHGLGYEPVLFDRPDEAIEAALSDPPALVFTDLNMPEITGIDLIRRLRERHQADELPIFLVTTQQSAEDDRDALDAGATAVLRKPFTPEDLGRALGVLAAA